MGIDNSKESQGEGPSVECQRSEHHANLVFTNPARHNAMSLGMWKSLLNHMTELASDDAIRLVVLSGAGSKAFVSGADISEFDEQRASSHAAADYNAIAESAEYAVDSFPKPTVAKIRGYCLGGGLGIALSCDIRICSDDASFSIPAGKLGLGYSYKSVTRLLRLVGQAKASELFYTGTRFSADDALKLGLVNHVVPANELDEKVDELTTTITGNAPKTLAAFKACTNHWNSLDEAGSTAEIDALVDSCYVSEDYEEGRLAFSEKRQPLFKNK